MKLLRRRRLSRDSDPFVRLRIGALMLAGVIVVGVIGYRLLGLGLLDALYQTIVTITTVGYREVGEVDGRYQLFTIVLILTGVGTALYTIGVFLETLVEGRLNDEFRRRRMQRSIDQLSGHVIVCGYGQVGQAIARWLAARGRQVVVVDNTVDSDPSEEVLLVSGDATKDTVLRLAGVERASTLVVALNQDADNLYVTLSARSLAPGLFIVARAGLADAEPKLYQAGADRVVNPRQIGGARMAALVVQPHVADFLDVVMHDRDLTVRIEEFEVRATSAIAGSNVGQAHIREETGATVLAIRQAVGVLLHNPEPGQEVGVGDVLIALGTDEQLQALGRLV